MKLKLIENYIRIHDIIFMRQKKIELIISSAKETLGIGQKSDFNNENRLMISS